MKKMIRRILVCASSLCLLMNAAGCTQNTKKTVNDGTYTGSAKGYNGTVTVSAVFSDGKMESLEVTGENETKTVADDALQNTAKYITENQSLNVDVSTGATQTSNAVIKAAGKAVTNAGGNTNEWQDDATGKHKNTVHKVSTDAVVVGGGLSGTAAALRLEQYGVKTAIVEKSDALGGVLSTLSHSVQTVTETDEESTAESAGNIVNDISTYGGSTGNEDLLNILKEELADTVIWQKDTLGVEFEDDYINSNAYQGNAVKEYSTSGGNAGNLLSKEAEVSGADIYTNTAVTALIKDDDGNITGVRAKSSSGDIYEISAKYVIIASGSYAGNSSLLETADQDLPFTGYYTDEGDLYTIVKNGKYQVAADGTSITSSLGFAISEDQTVDMYDAIEKAVNDGLMITDGAGNRFVSEDSSRQNLEDAVSGQSDVAWAVMNEKAYSDWKNSILNDTSLSEESRTAVKNDSSTSVYEGETLEDAAESAGIDTDNLLKETQQFNTYVKRDTDAEFGREELGTGIDADEKCYIVKLTKSVRGTTGGISTDENLNLLNKKKKTVSNVYVVGSAVGNVFGSTVAEGAENAWAFVSGKKAADTIITVMYPDKNIDN